MIAVTLLAACLVCTVAQKAPQKVNINYPYLTKVSEYLATKYEQDNLEKASQKADQMILLTALAERTSANIVKEREAKLPFAGGIEIPVESDVAEEGNLYFVAGIIEQQSKSYAVRKMDPWPMWQLVLGKMFRADSGKIYVIRYVTAQRDTVSLSSDSAKAAIKFALEGLNSDADIHQLASVIAVERQSLTAANFKQLTISEIKPAPSLEVYYVYFLTSDKRHPTMPAAQHAIAVLRTPGEMKIVRHTYYGEPGYTVLKGATFLDSVAPAQFKQKQRIAFKKGLANTIGNGVTEHDIQITGIISAAPKTAAPARRLMQAEVSVAGEISEESDAEVAVGGTEIDWSLAVSGSGMAVNKRMKAAGFTTLLSKNFKAAGIASVTPTAVSFESDIVLRNNQHPHSNKTIGFVVLTMGAFVLGVLLTAGIGVWGMRRNRQIQPTAAGGGGGASWESTPKYQRVNNT